MIQDIGSSMLDNSFRKRKLESLDIVFRFNDSGVSSDEDRLLFPTAELLDEIDETVYLFSVDEVPYFLHLSEAGKEVDGFSYQDLRQLRGSCRNVDLFIVFTAYHLWRWYMDNKFCGRCGHQLIQKEDERALICESCSHTVYPRINPAVIVGVIKGDCLLITRYRTGYAHNALVAGFTEIGETLEQTVEREVMEETGIKVKNVLFFDADAGVRNGNLHGAAAVLPSHLADGKGDAAGIGVFYCVRQKIDDNLPETHVIPEQPRGQTAVNLHDERKPFVFGTFLYGSFDPAQQIFQIIFYGNQFHFALFDFGKIKDSVDEIQKQMTGVVDVCGIVEDFGFAGSVQDHLVHADDRVDRGADFVGHAREKIGFGVVGAIRTLFFQGQILHGFKQVLVVGDLYPDVENVQPDHGAEIVEKNAGGI